MPDLDLLAWFRKQMKVYITIIKTYVSTQISSLSSQITTLQTDVNALKGLTGYFKGAFDTKDEIDALSNTRNGDYAVLRVDIVGTGTVQSPQYEAGIYVKSTGGWTFTVNLSTFNDIYKAVAATDAEAIAGVVTDKFISVKQVTDKIAAAISGIDTANKANLSGSATQIFNVAKAQEGSTQAVRADQFTDINSTQAQQDWDAS